MFSAFNSYLTYDLEAVKNAMSIAMTALTRPVLRRWRLKLDTKKITNFYTFSAEKRVLTMEQDFLLSLLMIIGIDLVLGADNAVVIALACRNLPVLQRNKAIILGTMLAIVFRIFITLIAVYLLKIPFLQLVGGVFLLYIAYNLIAGKEDDTSKIKSHPSLWRAIKTIVIADLLMGFDNVLAVAGAAQGHMLLVAMGLFISIPIIIWGSKIILVLLTKYPFLVYIGGGLLAFTSGKMIVEEPKLQGIFYSHPMLEMSIPYMTASFIILAGVLYHQMINFQTARRD